MSSDQVDYKVLNVDPDILNKAWDGDATAQLILGKAYFNAVYVEGNTLNAFKWIYLSANQGDMEAQFILGNLYSLGQGVKQSYKDAYHWYTKSAIQGYQKALIRIHNLYQQDIKMHCPGKLTSEEELRVKRKTPLKVEYYYAELNEQRLEDNKIIINNAMNYYSGQLEKYRSRDLDDMNIQLNIAFLYHHGYGVKKNVLLAIEYYTRAAIQGHQDASYNLGYLYEQNTHLRFNYRNAFDWYEKSAKGGNIAAQNRLAYFYEKDLHTRTDHTQAIYWYTVSALAGSSNSQLTLGKLYRKGEIVLKNTSEAIKWYELASNQGNQRANNCLNQLLQIEEIAQNINTETKSENFNQTPNTITLSLKLQKDIIDLKNSPDINKLKQTAQHAMMSDGGAMYQIGLMYYTGINFYQDKDTGLRWIKKAAKAGFQDAELKLSCMYEQGDEVDQDYHESSIWTSKLARKKNDIAKCKLGFLYKNGLGVRKDLPEASKWFKIAAEEGNVDAQYQFGLLLYEGEGSLKDDLKIKLKNDLEDDFKDNEEAFSWFRISFLPEKPSGYYKMGYMIEVGDYPKRDFQRNRREYIIDMSNVFQIYKTAAILGNKDAQFRLGRIYEDGKLTKQDLLEAHGYYAEASASGDAFYQTELAIRYINGVFDDPDYKTAFDLFLKAAKGKEPRAIGIFQTPVRSNYGIKDHSRILDMLIQASERGIESLEYIIGYTYEHGLYCESMKAMNSNYENAISWYSLAADKGDTRAKYRLGIIHEEGKADRKNIVLASRYYSQASEEGNSDAMYRLALMYLYGHKHVCRLRKGSIYFEWDGFSQDVEKAFLWFNKASNKGNIGAREMLEPSKASGNIAMLEYFGNLGCVSIQYKLGEFYECDDDQKSFNWFTLAAKGGLVDALYKLGLFYEKGRGTDCNHSKSIEYYEKAAKCGHDKAMYRLARFYHQNTSAIECDYLKAYNLYQKAAEYGNEMAIKLLAIMERGTEVPLRKNEEVSSNIISQELYNFLLMVKFVAEQGDIPLQYKLGVYYENSKEDRNYEEAFKWYKMASDNLHSDAIYRLALLYENGLGTNQDYEKSFQLYYYLKDRGSHDVLYRLGVAFDYGYGVNVDLGKALDLYIQAAKLGNEESQYIMGNLYDNGGITQKDKLRVLVWYTKAYLNGSKKVIQRLYSFYDDTPYESFFHRKLFQILSKFENFYKSDSDDYRDIYGSMYFKLGKMYHYGFGTEINKAAALKQFLTAYDTYSYLQAESFVTLDYSSHTYITKEEYIQRLQLYHMMKYEITSERQYKLGVLYYNDSKSEHTNQGQAAKITRERIVEKNYLKAKEYFNLASSRGNYKALIQVGLMILKGEGYKKNWNNAMERFAESSEIMDSHECYKYGMLFYKKTKLHQNFKIAYMYLQKAAENENTNAQVQLGLMFLQGKEIEYDCEEAMKYFTKSAKIMSLSECYSQGMKIYKSTSISDNHIISQIYLRHAARYKHAEAQAQLGLMYLQGLVSEINRDEIVEWIDQVAIKMSQDKSYNQPLKHNEAIEIDQNYTIAILYLKMATQKGRTIAMSELGQMFLNGSGVEKNYEEAIKWFRRSTVTMNPKECHDEGTRFYRSKNVDKNYEIALTYLIAAAEGDCIDDQKQLVSMYLNGLGTDRDYNTAVKWFQQSTRGMQMYDYYKEGMKFYKGGPVDRNYEIAFLYLKVAADNNDGKSQAQLGLMYLKGYGVEKNSDEAMMWFQRSTKGMYLYECYEQGVKFFEAAVVEKNYDVALLYFKAAAERNDGNAQSRLGLMYLKGYGVKMNHGKAMELFEQSAISMSPEDCYNQGMKFYEGEKASKIDPNYQIALIYLKKAAERGNGDAQAQLGIVHLKKCRTGKINDEAKKLFEESSRSMHPVKSYKQGMMFYEGNGVAVNYKIALIYLEVAAERDLGIANMQLGRMYLEGRGVEQNRDRAMEWIRKSIVLMSAYACYKNGMDLYNGCEGDPNYEMSLLYIRAAAEENDVNAQVRLVQMYLKGDGVEKDYYEAKKWIKRSIEYLSQQDCYIRGRDFHNGSKVGKNYEIALLYLTAAAESNDGDAQAQLCLMYLNGDGVERNRDEALKWFKRSTRGIYVYEYYVQGMKFYEGAKVPQNYEIALLFLNFAAQNCDVKAQIQLGLMYLKGIGVEQSHNEATKWFQKSKKRMKPKECYKQGMKFYKGDEVDRNFEAALFYLKVAADNNDGHAQTQLGLMCLIGEGVEEENLKAMEWFQQAITVLEPRECYSVGMKFFNGSGFPRNYIVSLIYLKSAAIRGNIYSQAQLGHAYLRGTGVDENYEEANLWYNRITLQNTNRISYELGAVYHSNTDGIQDFSKALKYYQEESSGEYKSYALRSIGLLYEYGDGVDQDYQKALEYYKKSADNYNKGAYFNLGLLYYYGRGVTKNYASALDWFSKGTRYFLPKHPMHVVVESDACKPENTNNFEKRTYSLQDEYTIYGEMCYHIGLMHQKGDGTVQDYEKAQYYFKVALDYGIARAQQLLN